MSIIKALGQALKKMDINAGKALISEMKKTGGLTSAEEQELMSALGLKNNLIGDVFIQFENRMKKAAQEGVTMTKEVRKYNSEELRLLDQQIAEGNSISQLAEMRGISPSSMRTVLKLNERQTLESSIISSITDEELTKLVSEGKTPKEMAEYFGLESGSSLTPRLKKLNYVTTQSKIDEMPDQYFIDAYNSGKLASNLAKELGVAPGYVTERYSRLNLVKEVFEATPEQIESISDMIHEGYSREAIAEKLGLSLGRIAKIISENGIKRPVSKLDPSLPRGKALKQIVKEAISWKDLERELKCSNSTVKKLLEEEKITFTPPKAPKHDTILELTKENSKRNLSINDIAESLNIQPKLAYNAYESAFQGGAYYKNILPELAELGYSPKQIAELLGMPESAVKKEIEKAIIEANRYGHKASTALIESLNSTKADPSKTKFMNALEKARKEIDSIDFNEYKSEDAAQKIIDDMCKNLKISRLTCIQLIAKYNNGAIDYTLKDLLAYKSYGSNELNKWRKNIILNLKTVESEHVSEQNFRKYADNVDFYLRSNY